MDSLEFSGRRERERSEVARRGIERKDQEDSEDKGDHQEDE